MRYNMNVTISVAAMKNSGDLTTAIELLQQTVEEARQTIGRMLNRS